MKTNCLDCGIGFLKRGNNHTRCDKCAKRFMKDYMRDYRISHINTGQGSGALPGKANSNYKHGICMMRRWAREKLASLNNCCERCGKIIDVSRKGTWAGHHRDHSRFNNTLDNLEILCKYCHQIEHECVKNFQGVTTIS